MTAPASARWTVRPVDHSPARAARIQPCECGRPVIVRGDSSEDVERGVFAHNLSPEHAAWRHRRARAGEPAELAGEGIG